MSTLIAPGPREVVSEERAVEIVIEWKAQIKSASSSSVETVVLTNKSYTAEAASVIATFLTEKLSDLDGKSVADGVKVADLSDMIASRMEKEGLQVLTTICNAFEGSNLDEVDLSDNAMGSKGISACSSVLQGQTSSLKRLSMCNNGLSADSMDEVADILTGVSGDNHENSENASCICDNLTKINFYNNMSGDGGCKAFARILKKCGSSKALSDIRFSGTRAGRPGSLHVSEALKSIADSGSLEKLTRLDLADNTFGTEGAANLSSVFSKCPHLTYVNLRDCILNDEGANAICKSLWSIGAPLVHLDMSGNEITKNGSSNLAELVEDIACSSLKVLHCEENELSSRGIVLLALALVGESDCGDESQSSSCILEEIRLGMNECGNVGGRALIGLASADKLPALKKICLDNNMFQDDVAEELVNVYGEKLEEMEDNDPDEDIDEDYDSDEDDDGDNSDDGQKDVGNDVDLDDLQEKVSKMSLKR
eukprot:CAMPEP_0194373076 /NCGR_PEP_ID=MMETSP0174-20130528/21500_1 /TAXON_ID=216777 /ORGANISM="Proboscia alata, Strain PI-D3" /LENGTH=481 /DNA_ID=CAMNT_0039151953 /DNA_START=54 /DNA_END=1499 /DNA_ORIENTATION=-